MIWKPVSADNIEDDGVADMIGDVSMRSEGRAYVLCWLPYEIHADERSKPSEEVSMGRAPKESKRRRSSFYGNKRRNTESRRRSSISEEAQARQNDKDQMLVPSIMSIVEVDGGCKVSYFCGVSTEEGRLFVERLLPVKNAFVTSMQRHFTKRKSHATANETDSRVLADELLSAAYRRGGSTLNTLLKDLLKHPASTLRSLFLGKHSEDVFVKRRREEKLKLSLLDVFKEYHVLEGVLDDFPWFLDFMVVIFKNELTVANSATKSRTEISLQHLYGEDAEMIAIAFARSLAAATSSTQAVHDWVSEYKSMMELSSKFPWFEGTMNHIAHFLLNTASWGTKLRYWFGAGKLSARLVYLRSAFLICSHRPPFARSAFAVADTMSRLFVIFFYRRESVTCREDYENFILPDESNRTNAGCSSFEGDEKECEAHVRRYEMQDEYHKFWLLTALVLVVSILCQLVLCSFVAKTAEELKRKAVQVITFSKLVYDAYDVAEKENSDDAIVEMNRFKVVRMFAETLPSCVLVGWFLLYEIDKLLRNVFVIMIPTVVFIAFMTANMVFDNDTRPTMRRFQPDDHLFSDSPIVRVRSFYCVWAFLSVHTLSRVMGYAVLFSVDGNGKHFFLVKASTFAVFLCYKVWVGDFASWQADKITGNVMGRPFRSCRGFFRVLFSTSVKGGGFGEANSYVTSFMNKLIPYVIADLSANLIAESYSGVGPGLFTILIFFGQFENLLSVYLYIHVNTDEEGNYISDGAKECYGTEINFFHESEDTVFIIEKCGNRQLVLDNFAASWSVCGVFIVLWLVTFVAFLRSIDPQRAVKFFKFETTKEFVTRIFWTHYGDSSKVGEVCVLLDFRLEYLCEIKDELTDFIDEHYDEWKKNKPAYMPRSRLASLPTQLLKERLKKVAPQNSMSSLKVSERVSTNGETFGAELSEREIEQAEKGKGVEMKDLSKFTSVGTRKGKEAFLQMLLEAEALDAAAALEEKEEEGGNIPGAIH